ncbi:hypothetical protein [Nesterenkonia pannonica]|uniref:hypothetical protein n=1 Tax=Nesterenkonia pannonica TaxID=1548602 RepID=UPI0021649229|nr:hypothetical protein [Nesterenkonia pannonica]
MELEDEHGPVLVYGIPYLEPQLHAAELGCERAHHTAVTRAVAERIRVDRAERSPQARTIVMAHLFAAKGTASASERNIGADVAAGSSRSTTRTPSAGSRWSRWRSSTISTGQPWATSTDGRPSRTPSGTPGLRSATHSPRRSRRRSVDLRHCRRKHRGP